MSELRLTPAAQADLSEIWKYTEARWGVPQARRYLREIRDGLERVAADPEIGRVREEVSGGYRSYAIGGHAAFHRVRPDHVDVIRILHQRMDPARNV